MTQHEAIRDIHDRVRQCFTRHKFKLFGDALSWLHRADYEIKKLEAGEQGMSKFSTDILWLVSLFGPKEAVDYKAIGVRKVPDLTPKDIPKEFTGSPKPRKRQKARRKRF